MFDIEFVSDQPEPQGDEQPDALVLRGRITLGDYTEEFLAPLGFWTREDYHRHWIEGARRLCDGRDRTAFFTQAMWCWWTMWREGDDVFVHEQILVPEALIEPPLDPKNPYRQIGERHTVSEDGQPVSEWHLKLADVEDFFERRSTQYLSEGSQKAE